MDLRDYLEGWPYNADRNVRLARGIDGREIISVRQPMGLEQYEADGRPDGSREIGADTVLDFHHDRIYAASPRHSEVISELSAADCTALFLEAGSYFDRLILLFRLKDWPRAERDAAHLLRLLEFTRQHASGHADRLQLDPWRHHLIRIHAVARAMILLDQGQYLAALQSVRDIVGIPSCAGAAVADQGKLAQSLLDSVCGSLLKRPAFHRHEASSFIRRDDFWTISYQGHTALLKCSRGLQCLALLLRSPGREFHVSELLGNMSDAPAMTTAAVANGHLYEEGSGLVTVGLDGGDPILDRQAKAECKRRLSDLRREIEEAEHFNDPARAANANDELNAIAQHLASATGLGGRDRKASSDAERARCAVTKRIKQTIHKIAEVIPALGQHLSDRIKTGCFCSYNPHFNHPAEWKF